MRHLFLSILTLVICTVASAQVYIGQKAPEISLPDQKDSIITLSSLRGKVVFLDFWASWCGPCRRANKANVKLYNDYKAKGLIILGVSVDDDKKDWMKAMLKDKLRYTNVRSGMGLDAPELMKYGVNEIPTTFLIDKNGIIRAVDAEGKELRQLIDVLLKE